MKSIFEYKNYQSYLLNYFQTQRGHQSRLAEALDCRSSFLTQVIDQKVDLTIDQALKAADFLGLSKNEKMAFLLYVQMEKVSDLTSKKFFLDQIEKLKIQNNRIKERLNHLEELSDEAKAQYYSSWIYGAVHILCAFSWIKTIDDVMDYLKLERGVVVDCIQFLAQQNLIVMKNNQLSIGKKQIHLSDDSPYTASHHINWRLKTIEKLAQNQKQRLNFSSLIGISKKDADRVQDIMLGAISEINQVVQKSGEEAAYIINFDFLSL